MRQPLHFTVSVPAMSTSGSQPARNTNVAWHGPEYAMHRSNVYAEGARLVALKVYKVQILAATSGFNSVYQNAVLNATHVPRDIRQTSTKLADAIRIFRFLEASENAPQHTFGDCGEELKAEVEHAEAGIVYNSANQNA